MCVSASGHHDVVGVGVSLWPLLGAGGQGIPLQE